jgi:predicted AAA+ superfamily ATPase
LKIDEQSGLKQILASNQKDVENYQVVPRELPSDEFERRVFIGVRRAGKSFMLYQKMQQMLAEGLAAVFIYGGRQ